MEHDDLRILILEYSAASGLSDPFICAEGYAMLNGLLKDFESKSADYLLAANVNFKSKYCNAIKFEGELLDWLDGNINAYDACLLIAPEENHVLYRLTKYIENKGVQVIGSNSDAAYLCSDKYEMYHALKDKVNIIKTEKVFFKQLNEFKHNINDKKVIKPADGVSCSNVNIVTSWDNFKTAANSMVSNLPYFILQDYIEGISASVSLLSSGKEALPLSLNLQDNIIKKNQISYNGGKVPFNHLLSSEAKEIAKKAVESIDGLKGYVGVDIILGDKVYVVEINSRITTPYIALRDVVNFNLGEAILDVIYGIFPSNININGEISFYKENNIIKKSNDLMKFKS